MKKSKQQDSILLTKEQAIADRKWFILDAKGKTLGRFASEVAKVLRGKHKPHFTPHVDCGDGVIVINASQIKVTGAKEAQKIYYYHTHVANGLREIPYRVMLDRKPDHIIREAVKGMMPLSRLGRQQMKKLRIYASDVHDLEAQQPISLTV
ncbi:MAG: 50S ribosomal protein L13 [Verrucomicrobia bacterium]|nr:50S ribosomal protein L13 [Verrucomicrobiota bacterium]